MIKGGRGFFDFGLPFAARGMSSGGRFDGLHKLIVDCPNAERQSVTAELVLGGIEIGRGQMSVLRFAKTQTCDIHLGKRFKLTLFHTKFEFGFWIHGELPYAGSSRGSAGSRFRLSAENPR